MTKLHSWLLLAVGRRVQWRQHSSLQTPSAPAQWTQAVLAPNAIVPLQRRGQPMVALDGITSEPLSAGRAVGRVERGVACLCNSRMVPVERT